MGPALRRSAGAVVVCSLLAAAAGYYRYSPEFALTAGQGAADSAEPAPGGSVTSPVTPSPSPTVSPTNAAPEPGPTTAAPPAAIRLEVGVEGRGVFEVTETVRLSAPVDRLHLAPPDVRLAGGTLGAVRALVSDVDLRADGHVVRVPGRSVREPMTVRLTSATDRFELHYRLRRTIHRNPSSPVPGRALGAIAPVVVGVPDDVPVSVSFRSAAVLNLSCPCLPPAEQTCFAGRRPNPRVRTDLARKDALVVVQLDLTKAR